MMPVLVSIPFRIASTVVFLTKYPRYLVRIANFGSRYFPPAESLIAKRSSVPHMLVRNYLEYATDPHSDTSNSPRCYLHRCNRHRYSWVALQYRSHPVFRSLVSNLIPHLPQRLSYTPLSKDLPGPSGSAVLQVTPYLPIGLLNSALN